MRIVFPLCLVAFAALLNVGALSPFLSPIADDFGVSTASVGLAATGSLILTAVAGLIVGPASDAYGHRRTIVFGLSLIAVSALGAAVSSSYGAFILFRMLGGVGFAACSGLPSAIAANAFLGASRQRALGIISAASVLAGILGAPLLTSVGSLTSWRGAFVLVGVVALLTVGITSTLTPVHGRRSQSPLAPRRIVAMYAPLVGSRRTLFLYAATLLQMLCLIGALTYTGAFLSDELGFSVREIGYAYMVQSAGGFAGSLLASRRSERLDLRVLYTALMAAMGVLFLAMFGLSAPPVLTVVILGCTGIAQAGGWVILATLLSEATPIGQGTTMVLNGSVLGIGGAIGAALGSLTLGLTGYGALGVVFPLAAFASGLMVWIRSAASPVN
jgi:DHA1 family inner membrane transport protein